MEIIPGCGIIIVVKFKTKGFIMKIININENDSGQRLDKFLHKMFKETMPFIFNL